VKGFYERWMGVDVGTRRPELSLDAVPIITEPESRSYAAIDQDT